MSTSSWRSSPTSERLAVGRVVGAKGLRGALRVELLTDWPERLEPGAAVYLEGEAAPRSIVAIEGGGRGAVVRLDGIVDREAAEALVGTYLEADRRSLPQGTYYWHELEGLDVETDAGEAIGRVVEVFRAGGAEVYRIEGADGRELLVPALRDVVRSIDLGARRMVVRYEPEEA